MRAPYLALSALLLATGCGLDLSDAQWKGDEGVLVFDIADCLSCTPVGIRVGARRAPVHARRIVRPLRKDANGERSPVATQDLLRGTFLFECEQSGVLACGIEEGHDPPLFYVDAVGVGTARVTLREEDGTLLDTTLLEVLAPTGADLFVETDTRAPATRVVIPLGEERTVHVSAFAEEGSLVAPKPWDWSVADPAVAGLWDPSSGLTTPDTWVERLPQAQDWVTVLGRSAGTTTLTVVGGGAESSVELVVE